MQQHGFTASELERQKAAALRRMEQFYLERDKTESRQMIEEYLRNFLVNETIPGIEVELALYKQFLPGITLEEVNSMSAERITSGNRVISVSVPQKEGVPIPTEAEVPVCL